MEAADLKLERKLGYLRFDLQEVLDALDSVEQDTNSKHSQEYVQKMRISCEQLLDKLN